MAGNLAGMASSGAVKRAPAYLKTLRAARRNGGSSAKQLQHIPFCPVITIICSVLMTVRWNGAHDFAVTACGLRLFGSDTRDVHYGEPIFWVRS